MQGNIVFSNELDRRYRDQGIVSVSVHPGVIATDLHKYVPKVLRALNVRPRLSFFDKNTCLRHIHCT